MTEQIIAGLPVPPANDEGPYALMVRLVAKPDRADALEQLLSEQAAAVAAEPGNVDYILHRDREDPTVFVFYESYVDIDAYRTHLRSSVIQQANDRIGDYLAGEYSLSFLSVRAGR